MRACHSDRMWFQPHQLGEHLGTRDNWNRALMRLYDFRIVIPHCCRTNDHLRITNVFTVVSFSEGHAHLLETVSCAGSFLIRPGNTKTKIHQHLCNSGHTYATDANEMYVLDLSKHWLSQLSVVRCLCLVLCTL